MRRLSILAVAAACVACTTPSPSATDGGHDGGAPRDDGGGAGDGSTSDGGGSPPGHDAAVPDGSTPDGGALDASSPCDSCVPSAECVDGTCVESGRPYGTACGEMGMGACVDGTCVMRTGCGDGYREPGPAPMREGCDDGNTDPADACSPMCEPTVFVVSTGPLAEERPSGPARSVAIAGDGRALAVWTSVRDGMQSVRARRFSAAGVPQSAVDAPIVIDPDVGLGWEARPTVVGLAAGGWVVAWNARDLDGDLGSIAWRYVAASGGLGTVEVANVETLHHQRAPVLASVRGGFVAAWTDESPLLSGGGTARIRARLYDGRLAPRGGEIEVSATDGAHGQAAVAALSGGFLVAWTYGTSTRRVVGRRFDAGGMALDTDAFSVSGHGGFEPAVAALEDGTYAVAWSARSVDPDGDVRTRIVAPVGTPAMGMPFDVAATGDLAERLPAVAPVGGGGFVVLVHTGTTVTGTPRDVELVPVGAMLAPESMALAGELTEDGLERHGTLARAARGLWVGWSDDGALGDPTAYRSFLGYLLAVE